MEVRISIGKTTNFLYRVLIILFIGAMVIQFIGYKTGHMRLLVLSDLFNLFDDQTAATWFNSILLLLVSLFAWAIATVPDQEMSRLKGYWKFLSVLFLAMSVDEVATIHERIGDIFRETFHTEGYFFFAFVIPGTVLVVLLYLVYLPFLKALPRRLAIGMVISGLIYVTGAAGVEAISSNWHFLNGDQTTYRVIASIEELLEMTGLILLLRFLLDHLVSLKPVSGLGWNIRLDP